MIPFAALSSPDPIPWPAVLKGAPANFIIDEFTSSGDVKELFDRQQANLQAQLSQPKADQRLVDDALASAFRNKGNVRLVNRAAPIAVGFSIGIHVYVNGTDVDIGCAI